MNGVNLVSTVGLLISSSGGENEQSKKVLTVTGRLLTEREFEHISDALQRLIVTARASWRITPNTNVLEPRRSCPSMCGLPPNQTVSSVNVHNQACAIFASKIRPRHRASLALEVHWVSVLSYPVHNSSLKPLSTKGCRQTAMKGFKYGRYFIEKKNNQQFHCLLF